MRIGSLFSGIGGLDLGLERGLNGQTIFQVEIEDFPQRVLQRHFPDALKFRDVMEVGAHNLPEVDLLCGGPPCQSWSFAGKRRGFEDARGQLALEYLRIVSELHPKFIVIENVPGFRKAMPSIVTGLTALGYHVQWDLLSAAGVGAPHLRRRFLVVGLRDGGFLDFAAHRLPYLWPPLGSTATRERTRGKRVLHDVQRLKALGNAVVPQVAEWVGSAIAGSLAEPVGLSASDPTRVPNAGYAALDGRTYSVTPADPVANLPLLPTPTTWDSVGERRGASPYVTSTGSIRSLREDGSSSNVGLAGLAHHGRLPTPTTQWKWDCSNSPSEDVRAQPNPSRLLGGPLHPEFVEWMMGFPRRYTEP